MKYKKQIPSAFKTQLLRKNKTTLAAKGSIYIDNTYSLRVKVLDVFKDSDDSVLYKIETLQHSVFFYTEVFPDFVFRDEMLETQKNLLLATLSLPGRIISKNDVAYIPHSFFSLYYIQECPDKWETLEKILEQKE